MQSPAMRRAGVAPVAVADGKQEEGAGQRMLAAIMYGLINSVLTIPCVYGYSVIIFSGSPIFTPFLPLLSKLVLFSCVVHQIAFSLKSSLPFSIGQVQDAGLIFLSTMAKSIVAHLPNAPVEEQIATTLVGLALGTALLGMVLVIMGRLRLAGLVSYIPMPVVAGYLAFIGFFCIEAGLSLCSGVLINGPADWIGLFAVRPLLRCIPGVLCGLAMTLIANKCSHFLALPGFMLAMPAIFYMLLLIMGASLDDARASDWITDVTPDTTFYKVFVLYSPASVHWEVLLYQFPTWLSMTCVVAFASCLDVAAIEMDMGKRLDINHELTTVGLSNFLSGITGGFTGSYIFSQTIFTYRSGTNSRIVGWIVVLSELGLFLWPANIMEFVPKFFFGATLIFIGFDLMYEWLVRVFTKVLRREYVVLIGSFVAINAVNLELGMGIGIVLAIMNFTLGYSRVRSVNKVNRSSNVVRRFRDNAILAEHRREILTLELRGYIFFGSAVQLMADVMRYVIVSNDEESNQPPAENTRLLSPVCRDASEAEFRSLDGTRRYSLLDKDRPSLPLPRLAVPVPATRPASTKPPPTTKFVVLDFKHVTGLDATSVRSCFLYLKHNLKSHCVAMAFTSMAPEVESLLRANDVLDDAQGHDVDQCVDTRHRPGALRPSEARTHVFANLANGLDFCEGRIISMYGGGARLPASTESVHRILADFRILWEEAGLNDTDVQGMRQFLRFKQFQPGQTIFEAGTKASHVYILVAGEVCLEHIKTRDVIPVLHKAEADDNSGSSRGNWRSLLGLPDESVSRSHRSSLPSLTMGSLNDLSVSTRASEPAPRPRGLELHIHSDNDEERQEAKSSLTRAPRAWWARVFKKKDGSTSNSSSRSSSVSQTAYQREVDPPVIQEMEDGTEVAPQVRVRSGCLFGEVHFYLQQPRHSRATATREVTLCSLSRTALLRMENEQPELSSVLHNIIVRSMSLHLANPYSR